MTDEPKNEATTPEPATPPGTNGGEQTPGSDEPKLTQTEANRLIGQARKQGRESGLSDLLKELGFEKADDLKALITEARDRKAAELTEAEKLQQQLEAERKKNADFEATLQRERQQRLESTRDAAIREAAQKANASVPADVVMWAKGSEGGDYLSDTLAEDGSVNDKAVAALVEACKKARAGWFSTTHPGSPSQGGGKPPVPNNEKLMSEIIRRQRY